MIDSELWAEGEVDVLNLRQADIWDLVLTQVRLLIPQCSKEPRTHTDCYVSPDAATAARKSALRTYRSASAAWITVSSLSPGEYMETPQLRLKL